MWSSIRTILNIDKEIIALSISSPRESVWSGQRWIVARMWDQRKADTRGVGEAGTWFDRTHRSLPHVRIGQRTAQDTLGQDCKEVYRRPSPQQANQGDTKEQLVGGGE